MKFFYLKTDDGRTVEIPENHLDMTKKLHPTWMVMEETQEAKNELVPPKTPKGSTLACPICGIEATSIKGLKLHKSKKHL
jgi:hypothetical protein